MMKLCFVVMAGLSQIGHFPSAFSSETKSVTPCIFLILDLIPNSRREMKKIPLWEDLRANVLNEQHGGKVVPL